MTSSRYPPTYGSVPQEKSLHVRKTPSDSPELHLQLIFRKKHSQETKIRGYCCCFVQSEFVAYLCKI